MTAGAPGQAAPLLPPEGGHPQHLHLSPSPSSSSAQLSPGRGIEIIIAIYNRPPRGSGMGAVSLVNKTKYFMEIELFLS